MKLISLFRDFLNDTVNLNVTRVNGLESSSEAIQNFVEDSAWEAEILEWRDQGSWAHKTIIKPPDQGEFDADLLVFVEPVEGWSATDYIDTLYQTFRSSGTYSSKVKKWSHCVTITYAGDKKIDVAPCVVNRNGYVDYEVCNGNLNDFEQTRPIEYTEWLKNQNAYSGNNSFRKVTRLLKYLRDVKSTFTCPSVLLTTLLGYRISITDKSGCEFTDIPTALKTIFCRLDDWLQTQYLRPSVCNPYLSSEDFSHLWGDDTQYENFRTVIHRYRVWIEEAFNETGRNESIKKWQRIFGDEFAAGIAIDEARSVSKAARDALYEAASTTAIAAYDAANDLVALVKRLGSRALPPGFEHLPHMKQPIWRHATITLSGIQVRAELYSSRGYGRIGPVVSFDPLGAGRWLHFTAFNSAGLPFGTRDFEVQWRITNTDEAAAAHRQLRGGFENPDESNTRWERLQYRGVHMVEAFVLLRRTRELMGSSQPFKVVIE